MSRKIIFLTLPLLLMFFSWSDSEINNTSTIDEIKTADELITLVNHYRQTIGKPQLIRNSTADRLATEHTNYMISKNDVSNDNFEVRWETLEQNENAEDISENVGLDVSAEKAMTAYLNRAWLKANVEGNFTHTGISVRKDSNGRYFYAQIFYR